MFYSCYVSEISAANKANVCTFAVLGPQQVPQPVSTSKEKILLSLFNLTIVLETQNVVKSLIRLTLLSNSGWRLSKHLEYYH